jgi:hypothetical protein
MIEIYLYTWLFTHFEPLQRVLDNLWERIPERVSNSLIIDYIYTFLGCHHCQSLFIGLIFLSPVQALMISYVAYVMKKIIK